MGFDEEQCPSRGPGLGHATDDGYTCDECGAMRVVVAPSVLEWIQSLRGISIPRVLKVSGEVDQSQTNLDEEEKLGDFAALTEDQWHNVLVERRYHESHQCDDR